MLTERQKLILRLVVDDYVRSAEPVGSRTIAKREGINFSPATVRNEMADLEEMGYLTQPHTSAGRIPSHKGYRFYVDHLMEPEQLSVDVIQKIRRLYTERFMEFEQVIQQTASVLSKLTNYMAIVLGPEFFDAKLKHIQLVPISEGTVVAIIVTNTAHVEHRALSVPEEIPVSEMEKLVNLLNHKLRGVPLYQFRERLYSEIAQELKKHISQYQAVMKILEQALLSDREDRVFMTGTTNIFSQPEFRDVEKVRGLFELLEQHDRIQGILASTKTKTGVQVLIGQENLDEAFADCSIITASYSIGGRPVGSLNILGPMRMEYKKAVSILRYLTQDLSYYLDRLYEKGT
ncbi:heat-inducible transcription repressor HrcA [Caldalkalibacillus thermarum]|uniref:heat-inducible transcriptional repressor HrcA n=1 Tax=Caldalkalibacillus thermarum TaxID=296745 RepID=UPI00166B9121|nr:heat-inducible transcriptional repressor HrcA [Caldalkalibacillus thermarum]GGK18386.1 heat-inducible transcription repressor HrcA [Caldalkalibacillus thermarum]